MLPDPDQRDQSDQSDQRRRPAISRYSNPYGDDKVMAACAIFGAMDRTGHRFSGDDIVNAIANMHERGNGLGGGFAIYGLYAGYEECYAFHVLHLDRGKRSAFEAYLNTHFSLILSEEIPVRETPGIKDAPLAWRYFLRTEGHLPPGYTPDEYVVSQVMAIHRTFADVCVVSSGKNMGVFKGVGFPEQIADFFCLDAYKGYIWTAHARFPTNTSGWWGGAHPFSLLDWSVVHNGEISSYGINRRYLEMFGYECVMETDTEVLAYAVDLLVRRHGLSPEMAAKVLAPPLWSEIALKDAETQALYRTLRQVYPSLLMNGPFAIVVGRSGEMIGLTDRIRLRPLTAATRGARLYVSSEESAIRLVEPQVDEIWIPLGGEPVIGRLYEKEERSLVQGTESDIQQDTGSGAGALAQARMGAGQ
jgi:glutamate synthase domain-containing protein 1